MTLVAHIGNHSRLVDPQPPSTIVDFGMLHSDVSAVLLPCFLRFKTVMLLWCEVLQLLSCAANLLASRVRVLTAADAELSHETELWLEMYILSTSYPAVAQDGGMQHHDGGPSLVNVGDDHHHRDDIGCVREQVQSDSFA